METNKNNSNRVALIIALSFAVGFGVATGAYFMIFCEDCIVIQSNPLNPGPDPCQNDPSCIDPDYNSTDTTIASEIGKEKVQFLHDLVNEPIIQNALKISNKKDSQMGEDIRTQIYVQREKIWTTAIQPTPFMNSIFENDVADFLRDNHVIRSEEFGDVVFGEHILTNLFGPNVAVSVITDNYLQSNDDWWQQAIHEQDKVEFARECEFDSSAQMFSEDLIIGIYDENGQLIGMMNSATPCDVTQASLNADKSIDTVPEEKLSDIGKFKISYLQGLMKNPTIQEALRMSNQKFSSFTNDDLSNLKEKTNWPKPDIEPTDLQLSIINNEVAYILRENLVVNSEEYGELVFPEMILTNAKGANVASTDRTYNYIQYFEEWWIVTSQKNLLVRQCGYDRSIQMNSEDIIFQIFDKNGEFIGILNSASTCDVILNKETLFYGDSN
jgi:hypothetical protein